ncbi:MAG: prepilin-type N-terminal cleavage/methylation domain-containing protein [Candidatus Omnitrophica bacterium]|nr:prepilin-type N-terminal cleavage/methylation domain-containing protein [Candidatus Omnitrophota bacterium]
MRAFNGKASLNAFTLTELMIVIVIIGILATLSIVQFAGPKEQSLEKEARANLKLIAAAQKIYRMETGFYANASNEREINSLLRLMLPSNDTTKNWEYKVTSPGPSEFIANATRTKGPGTMMWINETEEEPIKED